LTPPDIQSTFFSVANHPTFRSPFSVSNLLLLEIAMYRSWVIDHRGTDLNAEELEGLSSDLHEGERLQMTPQELKALLEASMNPEHREALRSLRQKTGFDARVSQWPTLPDDPQPA